MIIFLHKEAHLYYNNHSFPLLRTYYILHDVSINDLLTLLIFAHTLPGKCAIILQLW